MDIFISVAYVNRTGEVVETPRIRLDSTSIPGGWTAKAPDPICLVGQPLTLRFYLDENLLSEQELRCAPMAEGDHLQLTVLRGRFSVTHH